MWRRGRGVDVGWVKRMDESMIYRVGNLANESQRKFGIKDFFIEKPSVVFESKY